MANSQKANEEVVSQKAVSEFKHLDFGDFLRIRALLNKKKRLLMEENHGKNERGFRNIKSVNIRKEAFIQTTLNRVLSEIENRDTQHSKERLKRIANIALPMPLKIPRLDVSTEAATTAPSGSKTSTKHRVEFLSSTSEQTLQRTNLEEATKALRINMLNTKRNFEKKMKLLKDRREKCNGKANSVNRDASRKSADRASNQWKKCGEKKSLH